MLGVHAPQMERERTGYRTIIANNTVLLNIS
jgi:hypothetical protein